MFSRQTWSLKYMNTYRIHLYCRYLCGKGADEEDPDAAGNTTGDSTKTGQKYKLRCRWRDAGEDARLMKEMQKVWRVGYLKCCWQDVSKTCVNLGGDNKIKLQFVSVEHPNTCRKHEWKPSTCDLSWLGWRRTKRTWNASKEMIGQF